MVPLRQRSAERPPLRLSVTCRSPLRRFAARLICLCPARHFAPLRRQRRDAEDAAIAAASPCQAMPRHFALFAAASADITSRFIFTDVLYLLKDVAPPCARELRFSRRLMPRLPLSAAMMLLSATPFFASMLLRLAASAAAADIRYVTPPLMPAAMLAAPPPPPMRAAPFEPPDCLHDAAAIRAWRALLPLAFAIARCPIFYAPLRRCRRWRYLPRYDAISFFVRALSARGERLPRAGHVDADAAAAFAAAVCLPARCARY